MAGLEEITLGIADVGFLVFSAIAVTLFIVVLVSVVRISVNITRIRDDEDTPPDAGQASAEHPRGVYDEFYRRGVALASGRIEEIARACHEVNAAYCRALGDDSQPLWENAPAWQRESAIAGVRFHFTNPDAPPSASHENWMVEKERAGWIYGPHKDPEAKTHPCMVPFDALPAEQQAKDFLFHATVRVAAALVSLNGSIQDRKDYYDQIFDEWCAHVVRNNLPGRNARCFLDYMKQRLHFECHPLPAQQPDDGEHRPT